MTARVLDFRLRLMGSGSAFPGLPVSNEDLLDALSHCCDKRGVRRAAWIMDRLGIHSRHLSRDLKKPISGTRPGMDNPSLCCEALQATLTDASVSLADCQYLIGHTASPHTPVPPNIAWVAERLDFSGPYLELRQACTGFANALQIAAGMLVHIDQAPVAIVGSETGSVYSKLSEDFLDREQLVNYVQMGDGAGAVLLGADTGEGSGIISDIFIGHIGLGWEPGFIMPEGGSASPHSDTGVPRFHHATNAVFERGTDLFLAGLKAMENRGYHLSDFDWILPHQANGRMAELFENRLGVPADRILVTANRLGNLGSAAIWVALDQLRRSENLRPGDRVLVLGAEATKYMYGGFVYHR